MQPLDAVVSPTRLQEEAAENVEVHAMDAVVVVLALAVVVLALALHEADAWLMQPLSEHPSRVALVDLYRARDHNNNP